MFSNRFGANGVMVGKTKIMRQFLVFLVCLGVGAGCVETNEAVAPACVEKPRDPNAVCYALYQPVCGCNRKTYANDCEARASGITTFTPGECKQ